jgi:hypothetical protein
MTSGLNGQAPLVVGWAIDNNGEPFVTLNRSATLPQKMLPDAARKFGVELVASADQAAALAPVYRWLKQHSSLPDNEVAALIMSLRDARDKAAVLGTLTVLGDE